MVTFFKANIASLSASALDYLVTFLAKLFLSPLDASVAGTVAGGILNFCMGRTWVFRVEDGDPRGQVVRYLLVWVGNVALTTAGVYLLLGWGVNVLVAKIIVSVLMGLTYNFFLQKLFVFK
jgi:putative flippase GtrA